MREWIEHYLFHGVEHIYMVNDKSTDNYMEILQPYIDKNIVTVFDLDVDMFCGRQYVAYNTFFLPILKKTYWFGIFDMDEFLYSSRSIDLHL